MANSYVEYTTAGTGTNGLGQTTFSYSGMDVLSADHVFCKIQSYDGSSLSWAEASVASRNATAKTITLNSVPSGTTSKVRVYRNTVSTPLVDFVDGARLTESDLDTAYKQGLLATQEVKEDAAVNGNTGVTNLTLTGLTSVQNLTATGTVVIPSGSAATHFYREGVVNATLHNIGGSISYSHQKCEYTKIGRMVWYSVYLQLTGSDANANDFQVDLNTPYNIHTPNGAEHAANGVVLPWIGFNESAATAGYIGVPQNGGTKILIKAVRSVVSGTANTAAVTYSDCQAALAFQLSGFYFTS